MVLKKVIFVKSKQKLGKYILLNVLDRPVEIYELAHEPSLMKSSSSNYVKHSSEILDYFDYHSDYSTFTSVSTIQNKIRNKSKRKLQQSYRDEEDVESITSFYFYS